MLKKRGRPKTKPAISRQEKSPEEQVKPQLDIRLPYKVESAIEREVRKVVSRTVGEVEAVDTSIPGTKVDARLPTARKIPFTRRWFEEHYPMVTFTAMHNLPVTINGVAYDFRQGNSYTVPEPFKAEYERYFADQLRHSRNIVSVEGVVQVYPGHGPLPPEREEE